MFFFGNINGETALFINLIFDNLTKKHIKNLLMASQNNLNMNKAISEAINTFVASVGQGHLSASVLEERKKQELIAVNKLLNDADLGDNAKTKAMLHKHFCNVF